MLQVHLTMFSSRRFCCYFLPGFIFQSVLIGGGYGTGRELAEFFLSAGPLTGLLGMLVSTLMWCLVRGVTFDLARSAQTYDYRSFSKFLLGRVWVLYELCYLFALVITLAVLGSAAGNILTETFRLPYFLGVAFVMASVAALVFKGSTRSYYATKAPSGYCSCHVVGRYCNHTVWFSCFSRSGLRGAHLGRFGCLCCPRHDSWPLETCLADCYTKFIR